MTLEGSGALACRDALVGKDVLAGNGAQAGKDILVKAWDLVLVGFVCSVGYLRTD